MVMVARSRPAVAALDEARNIRRRLGCVHGLRVLEIAFDGAGVRLALAAHSVQAADFTEAALEALGIEPPFVWGEKDGELTLSAILWLDV